MRLLEDYFWSFCSSNFPTPQNEHVYSLCWIKLRGWAAGFCRGRSACGVVQEK